MRKRTDCDVTTTTLTTAFKDSTETQSDRDNEVKKNEVEGLREEVLATAEVESTATAEVDVATAAEAQDTVSVNKKPESKPDGENLPQNPVSNVEDSSQDVTLKPAVGVVPLNAKEDVEQKVGGIVGNETILPNTPCQTSASISQITTVGETVRMAPMKTPESQESKSKFWKQGCLDAWIMTYAEVFSKKVKISSKCRENPSSASTGEENAVPESSTDNLLHFARKGLEEKVRKNEAGKKDIDPINKQWEKARQEMERAHREMERLKKEMVRVAESKIGTALRKVYSKEKDSVVDGEGGIDKKEKEMNMNELKEVIEVIDLTLDD